VGDFVISIDVGGTKSLVAIVDRHGRIISEWQQPTRFSAEDDVYEVVRFARACLDHVLANDKDEPSKIVAVAAGFPEYVSADGRLTSHEVLRWTEQPADALARAFVVGGAGIPIVVESDVRLGARGEATLGAGAHVPSNFYVSLGTGLSSVFVLDSHIWKGARGEAIALGEHTISTPGFANLESFCSGTAIESRYRAEAGEQLTGPEISDRAAHDDDVARYILDTAGAALGDALADIAHVLDPHVIVVGGGLGSTENRVTLAAFERYTHLMSRRISAPAIVRAQLDHRSSLLGGAVAAWGATGVDLSLPTKRSSQTHEEASHE